ncbi:MAG: NYN domain-containing protein [Chloroflexaceae bacterium]|nr:NYN domain-containing protein [Chloroflexaceae bacterium]
MTTEQVRPDVAVFIDFENVYVSVHEKLDESPNFESIMDRCNDIGRVVIARAYADWYRYPRITSALYANGIEPIYVPTYYYDKEMGRTGRAIKNSVDMNLCIDAMKALFINANVEKFVLITGDRDFIPLVNSIRQQGKEVFIIGIGGAASAHLAQSADEFIFYEQLIGKTPPPAARKSRASRSEPEPASSPRPTTPVEADIYDTLVEAVHLVRERGYLSTLGSLKLVMKELMGGDFKESRYKDQGGRAFTKFKDFVVEAERRGKVQIYTNGTVSEVFLPGEDAHKLSQFAEIKGEESQAPAHEPVVQNNGTREHEKPAGVSSPASPSSSSPSSSSSSSSSSSRSRRRRRPRNQRHEAAPSPTAEVADSGAEERPALGTPFKEPASRQDGFAEVPESNGAWDSRAEEPIFLLEDHAAPPLTGGPAPADGSLGRKTEAEEDILAGELLLFLEDDDTLLFEAGEFLQQPAIRKQEAPSTEERDLPFLEDRDDDFLFNVGEALTLSQMLDSALDHDPGATWFDDDLTLPEPVLESRPVRPPIAATHSDRPVPVGEAPDDTLFAFAFSQARSSDRADELPQPTEATLGEIVAEETHAPEAAQEPPPVPVTEGKPASEISSPPPSPEAGETGRTDDESSAAEAAEAAEVDTVFAEEEWHAFRTMMQGFPKPVSFNQIFDSLRDLRKEQIIIRTNEQLRNLVKQAISNGVLERSGRGKRVYYALKPDTSPEEAPTLATQEDEAA